MFYIFLLIVFVPDTQSWFSTEKADPVKHSGNKNFNPICWVTSCKDDEPENTLTWNPKCWFSDCEAKQKTEINPLCWFKDCQKNENKNWLSDEPIMNWSKEQMKRINCWFKECSSDSSKKITEQSYTEKIKNLLNAARPQEPLVESIFKSEWSPYCWFSECCNQDSIPSSTNCKYLPLIFKNN